MRFSLKVKSIHTDLYNNYSFKINDLKTLVDAKYSAKLMRKEEFDLKTKIKTLICYAHVFDCPLSEKELFILLQ